MFAACADPKAIEGLTWVFCYLTSAKHVDFYWSFLTVLLLLAITAPAALGMGFMGATAARSHIAPVSWLGKIYIWMVRGVPRRQPVERSCCMSPPTLQAMRRMEAHIRPVPGLVRPAAARMAASQAPSSSFRRRPPRSSAWAWNGSNRP